MLNPLSGVVLRPISTNPAIPHIKVLESYVFGDYQFYPVPAFLDDNNLAVELTAKFPDSAHCE